MLFVRNWALQGVMVLCLGSLGAALYLQHALDWQPCPLCILQRLSYLGCAVFAGLALWSSPRADQPDKSPTLFRAFQGLTVLSALVGVALAARHLWVKAHPAVSCGIDPLETAINAQWWVQQLPWLLKADGLCFMPLPPLLGLQLPVWSLLGLLLAGSLAVWHKAR